MPIVPSQAREIEQHIARLDSPRASQREAAVARLTLLGGRAIDHLLRAIPEASATTLLGILAVLERLRPERALPALLGLCRHPEAAVARRALAAAAAYRHPQAVPVLAESASSGEPEVALAAVRALMHLHDGGLDEALEPLVDVLLDESRADNLRRAAAGVLTRLPRPERRVLLARLSESRSPALRAHAANADRDSRSTPTRARREAPASAAALVAQLEGGPAATQGRAQRRLLTLGASALPAVHRALARGPAANALARLADIVAEIGNNTSVPVLADALRHLTSTPEAVGKADGARARVRLHVALAALGSRIAIQDLRSALAARPPVDAPDLLRAVAAVGDARLLPPLAALALDQPELGQECQETLRMLVQRARLRRNAPGVRSLPEPHRKALLALWPKTASRRS